jgi:hypothetical protein
LASDAGEGAFARENIPAKIFHSLSGGKAYTAVEYDALNAQRLGHFRERKIRISDPRLQAIWMYRLLFI